MSGGVGALTGAIRSGRPDLIRARHDGRWCVSVRAAEAFHPRSASARTDDGVVIVCSARFRPCASGNSPLVIRRTSGAIARGEVVSRRSAESTRPRSGSWRSSRVNVSPISRNFAVAAAGPPKTGGCLPSTFTLAALDCHPEIIVDAMCEAAIEQDRSIRCD